MKRRTRKKSAGPKVPRSLQGLFPNIKSVQDADSPVVVSVNAKDCVTGKKLDAGECAMAKAVKRQFHAQGAVIGLAYSYIVRGNTALRFKTPASVAREIVSFDRNQDFAPGTYQLSPVCPSARFDRDRSKERIHATGRTVRRIHRSTVRVRALERGSVSA